MVPALGDPVLGGASRTEPLETRRLRLRRWRKQDLEAFAALNAHPKVMEHFPAPLTAAESAFVLEQIEDGFERNGFGIWALETRDDATFLGLAGLSVVPFEANFTPAVEIGWRLLPEAWGHGYATEAAGAALDHGFGPGRLGEIVSFASKTNAKSIAVMERLNMARDADGDFDHPLMTPGDPLAPHVLYRVSADAWAARRRE